MRDMHLGSESYADQAGPSELRVGVKHFNGSIQNVFRDIVSHKEKTKVVGTLHYNNSSFFLLEAVRNDIIFYDVVVKRDGHVLLSEPSYDLVQSWEKFSKVAYTYEPSYGVKYTYATLQQSEINTFSSVF
nr:hypothetical protein [Tanacetum cinerariifolium]